MNNEQKTIIYKTIADYNLIATKFSSTRSSLSQDLIELGKIARTDDVVLDYGCGNGRLCQLFNTRNYLGVDPSAELIKLAKTKYSDYHFKLIKPCEIPEGESFDIIYCLAVIHHFPDEETQRQLINGLGGILKAGGKLVLTAWCLDQSDSIIEIPFKSGDVTIQRQIFSFSQANLELLTKSSGLQILSSKNTPRNRGVYSNIEIIAQLIS